MTASFSGGFIQITRGRHSGRASPCEREPESSKPRGSFLHEVLTNATQPKPSVRAWDRANKPSGVYWIPALRAVEALGRNDDPRIRFDYFDPRPKPPKARPYFNLNEVVA